MSDRRKYLVFELLLTLLPGTRDNAVKAMEIFSCGDDNDTVRDTRQQAMLPQNQLISYRGPC